MFINKFKTFNVFKAFNRRNTIYWRHVSLEGSGSQRHNFTLALWEIAIIRLLFWWKKQFRVVMFVTKAYKSSKRRSNSLNPTSKHLSVDISMAIEHNFPNHLFSRLENNNAYTVNIQTPRSSIMQSSPASSTWHAQSSSWSGN